MMPLIIANRQHWLDILRCVQLLAVIVHAIGITSICGYLVRSPILYTWVEVSAPMAIGTAIAFMVLSLAVFLSATVQKRVLENS